MADTISSLVAQGYLTKKQGDNLPRNLALRVGKRNKQKKHKPKKWTEAEWQKHKEEYAKRQESEKKKKGKKDKK